MVRRRLGIRRVGHAGTLDPFATGLLTLLVGRCTRLAPFLVGLDKTYEGTIVLGRQTTTDDATGDTVLASAVSVSDGEVAGAMYALTGAIEQIPPQFSAKKVDGRTAYRQARRGHTVTLAPRAVYVHAFELVGRDGDTVRFRAHVGSGTYIRALARDIGIRLGCGAHLSTLRRTKVGPWSVAMAPSLAAWSEQPALEPPAQAVTHLPSRTLSSDEVVEVRHGRSVPDGDADGPVALFADGDLVAIALARAGTLYPTVVLAA